MNKATLILHKKNDSTQTSINNNNNQSHNIIQASIQLLPTVTK